MYFFCVYVAFIICGLCWVFVFFCKLLGKARQASGDFVVARVAEFFVQFVVGLCKGKFGMWHEWCCLYRHDVCRLGDDG